MAAAASVVEAVSAEVAAVSTEAAAVPAVAAAVAVFNKKENPEGTAFRVFL